MRDRQEQRKEAESATAKSTDRQFYLIDGSVSLTGVISADGMGIFNEL